MVRAVERAKGGYQAHIAAAAASCVLALIWVIAVSALPPLHIGMLAAFGLLVPAPQTVYIFAGLQIALAVGIYFRKRVAWILAVSFSGAQLVGLLINVIPFLWGNLLDGILAFTIYGTVFSLQISAFEDMEPSPAPHIEGAAIGGITAVLWLVDGSQQGHWTAATLAAFGARIPMSWVILFCVLEAGFAVGIYLRSRAIWAFGLSFAATLALPMTIATARLFWHKHFVDSIAAVFLHASLLTTQAISLAMPTQRVEPAPRPSNA
jgi:hypothetical protein